MINNRWRSSKNSTTSFYSFSCQLERKDTLTNVEEMELDIESIVEKLVIPTDLLGLSQNELQCVDLISQDSVLITKRLEEHMEDLHLDD